MFKNKLKLLNVIEQGSIYLLVRRSLASVNKLFNSLDCSGNT